MNEELRKMLESINAKKQEVRNLVADNKIDEATKVKGELINMQAKFDLMYDLEEGEQGQVAKQNKGEGQKNTGNALVNVIKARLRGVEPTNEDVTTIRTMTEGSDEDGGLTVPKDISTTIKELRRSQDALENLVNVERVSTLSGTRVIEKHAEHTPFDNVDEEAEFPGISTPQFEKFDYKVKKKGGILKVSRELLQDTAENILRYLKNWIAKKSKATRNVLIINQINEMTKNKEVAVKGIDDLKRVFNITLDPAIAINAGVLTNQSGFNWLDTLKDEKGNYILQPDPTNATRKLLFGTHPVVVVSNKTMPSKEVETGEEVTEYKHPVVCGDLKEAITIFDRETLTIDISSVAGELWKHDQTGIKVRERLDIKAIDTDAIIKAEVEETVGK